MIAKLATYKTTPENGLALFCGYAMDPIEQKKKKVSITLEPWAPLVSGMYRCDSNFHTKMLRDQIEDKMTFGFIIIDGSQTTFHTLTGDSKKTILKIEVDLPKKHGRGGQSKNRFERIRIEKRGWYTSKIAELATQHFIENSTNIPNVSGLVIGGSASLKEDILKKLDPRLVKIVAMVVDVQYNGETGLNQAITLASNVLSNVKIVNERNILSKFFDEIAKNGKYCFGVEDTLYALTSGLIEILLLWKNLNIKRAEIQLGEEKNIKFLKTDETPSFGEWKINKIENLVDWILEHYKEFGAKVELVSDQSEIGNQFIQGFGGLAGFLRFDIELPSTGVLDEEEEGEYEW